MRKKDIMKKNGKKDMTAIGPKIKTGMKAIGPMMIYMTWMSMDASRRKEKERKEERQERKG